MGYDVVGVDISGKMIENARKIASSKELNIQYEVGDAARLKYSDSFFDNAIFSNNGWTQIPGEKNRIKALKEIFRVLKTGGYCIFTTHTRGIKDWFNLFWVKQWVKLYALKPLGFEISEIDFGDRFFRRETGGTLFEQKQFIHIPSFKEVKKQIIESGFSLINYQERRSVNIISSRDKNHNYPMFYICKK